MCELCATNDTLIENELAYVRFDNSGLSTGHALIVPRRHIPDFFDMTREERAAVDELLQAAHKEILARFSPNGFNILVNVGEAAGQKRMHVHMHLIPRYVEDVPDHEWGSTSRPVNDIAGSRGTRPSD
jgi:diadenosine tetraphosphate (Ap4A) HIT family hydrolase